MKKRNPPMAVLVGVVLAQMAFLSPARAADGGPIVVIVNNAEFSKYFVQAAFTGKDVTPPREVSNGRDVKSIVAGSPGAIGFIRGLDFHGDGSDGGVRAVKVEGLLASDASYKLRM